MRGIFMSGTVQRLFNSLPQLLNDLGSLGVAAGALHSQQSGNGCIWSGYGQMGYNPMGYNQMGAMPGGSSAIVNAGIMRMNQYTQSVISGQQGMGIFSTGYGGQSCYGGGGITGGNPAAQQQFDPGLGQNMARGRDTKFINSSDWDALNAKADSRTSEEEATYNNFYRSGLANLASSFKSFLDGNKGNNDGKVSKDEFIKFFKDVMSKKYKAEGKSRDEIEQLAQKAWDNINANSDCSDQLDEGELMAMMEVLDSTDAKDGNITSDELAAGLANIADGTTDVKTVYNSLKSAITSVSDNSTLAQGTNPTVPQPQQTTQTAQAVPPTPEPSTVPTPAPSPADTSVT